MNPSSQIVKQLIESEYPLTKQTLKYISEQKTTLAEAYKDRIQWMIDYRTRDLNDIVKKLEGLKLLQDSCDELFADANQLKKEE